MRIDVNVEYAFSHEHSEKRVDLFRKIAENMGSPVA